MVANERSEPAPRGEHAGAGIEGERSEEADMVVVVQPGARARLQVPNTSLICELLTDRANRQIQAFWITLQPGEAASAQPFAHGGHELDIVVRGELVAQVGDESYELGPGASISFPGRVPHTMYNHGAEPAGFIAVTAPAAY